LNEEIQNIIKQFVKILNPLKIYLFGSFARGNENIESDYDFYIIMNKNFQVTNETITR